MKRRLSKDSLAIYPTPFALGQTLMEHEGYVLAGTSEGFEEKDCHVPIIYMGETFGYITYQRDRDGANVIIKNANGHIVLTEGARKLTA